MRSIHPNYRPITITCVGCGTKVETRSTRGKDFSIDVCSHCHPFYTGRQKFVDSAGRVERFQKKWANVPAKPAKAEKPKPEPKDEKPKAEAKPKKEPKPQAEAKPQGEPKADATDAAAAEKK